MLLQVLFAVSVVAILLSSPAHALIPPPCAPPGAEICQVMLKSEFVSAYRAAYDDKLEPVDAVSEIRFNLRQAVVGAGRAGPAAIGKQLDVALDGALARIQQRICKRTQVLPYTASAVADALAGAAHGLGARVSPEQLGGMTGSFMGSLEPRGVACLCGATRFDAIATACSLAGSR